MKVSKCFVALFFAVALAAGAMAQNAPAEFLMVYDIQVRPGAHPQFEEYIRKIREAADEVGAPQHWVTSQVTFGGPGNHYVIALQFDEWGALDGWDAVPQILEQAYGEDEAAKIVQSGFAAVEHSENTINRLLPDLSYNADDLEPAPMYRVRRSEIHREMQPEYRLFLARVNEAWEKAGDSRTDVRRISAMGETAVYSNATPFTNWSEWDDAGDFWEMMETAHGEMETRRLQEVLPRCVKSSELFVVTVRPDLSRMPESSSTSE